MKRFPYFLLLAIFVSAGIITGICRADTVMTFENMAGAKLDYTRYDLGDDSVLESSLNQNFDTRWPAANGFYWATPTNSLPDYQSAISTVRYTQSAGDSIVLSFSGGADTAWGVDWYTTYGFGVSSLFVNDKTAAAYQAINLAAQPVNLAHTATVFASSSAENQTFLFAYDNSYNPEPYSVPTLFFSEAVDLKSIDFANTAYTHKAIEEGTTYGMKYPEKVGVNIYGLDAAGKDIPGIFAEVVLSAGTDVVEDWMTFDFETEAKGLFEDVNGLRFEMFSTDVDPLYGGFFTPAYFALDNIVLAGGGITPPQGNGVPEPATWIMLLMAAGWMAWRKMRKG